MKRKYKISLIVVSILLVLGVCIGLSYAYYMASGTQKNSNAITGDCFKLSFTDNNDISLKNAIPMSDSAAASLVPYEFKVKNICNIDAKFDINLETLNSSTMDTAAIKYKLNDLDSNILANTKKNDSSEFVNDNVKVSNRIHSDSLKAGDEKTFNLRLWIDKKSTIEQAAEKIFKSKIVIKAVMTFEEEIAMLDRGGYVNSVFRQLGEKAIIDYENQDDKYRRYNISTTSIKISKVLPAADIQYINIASSESISPIYAWIDIDETKTIEHKFDNNVTISAHPSTIYIYSPVEKIYLNKDSSFLFNDLYNLNSIDLPSFDTSYVTNMYAMFLRTSSLTSLDLSNFNTQNVIDMSHMFYGMSNLTNLDLSNFNTQNVTNMSYMFYEMSNLTNLDLSSFGTSNVTDMSHMFSEMSSLTSLDLSNFNTQNVTDMDQIFYKMSSLTNLNLNNFNTKNITDMSWMFYGVSSLTSLDLSSFDTSNVTNMDEMFSNMSSLTSLDISNFNTQNVTEMSNMFSAMRNLTSLDLSHFDTSNVTNMSWMFSFMNNLTSLDISNFNTQNVTNMSYMFSFMNNLTSLDLSSFNTSKVTDMSSMFYATSNVKTIYVGTNWNTSAVTSSSSMFGFDSKLVGGAGTTYNDNHVDKAYAHVDEGTSNPGYFTLKTN